MSKIFVGHKSDAKFVYDSGQIHEGAFSFELDIANLDKWSAVIKVYCTQDAAQTAMNLLNITGYVELTICQFCVFTGDAELEKVTISGAVHEVVICEYTFKGIGKLNPPMDNK